MAEKERQTIGFVSQLEDTDSVKMFFPGSASIRDVVHFNSSFDDKGQLLVHTYSEESKPGKVVMQRFDGMNFSEAVPIHEDTIYSYSDPHLSADGKTMILSSTLPHHNDSVAPSLDALWIYELNDTGWGKGTLLNLEMDTVGRFFFPSLTGDMTMYFSFMPMGSRNSDIYRSTYSNGNYEKPVALPDHINTDQFEGDPFIDRAERFIIFAGFNREENYGLSDLYICFKTENGWTEAVNLGSEINSHGYDGSPYVTPDDQFLIFTSSRHPELPQEQEYFNLFYTRFNLESYRQMALSR